MNHYLGTRLAPWEIEEQVPEVWVAMIVAAANRQAEMADKGLLENR